MSLLASHPAMKDTGTKQNSFTVIDAGKENPKGELDHKFWLLLKVFENNFSNSCWFKMLVKLKDE